MATRYSEPTVRSAYRHSMADLVVLVAAALILFLNFWPPLLAATKSGEVVRILPAKTSSAVKAPHASAARFMPVHQPVTRKAAARP